MSSYDMIKAGILILAAGVLFNLAACAQLQSEKAITNQNAERPPAYAF